MERFPFLPGPCPVRKYMYKRFFCPDTLPVIKYVLFKAAKIHCTIAAYHSRPIPRERFSSVVKSCPYKHSSQLRRLDPIVCITIGQLHCSDRASHRSRIDTAFPHQLRIIAFSFIAVTPPVFRIILINSSGGKIAGIFCRHNTNIFIGVNKLSCLSAVIVISCHICDQLIFQVSSAKLGCCRKRSVRIKPFSQFDHSLKNSFPLRDQLAKFFIFKTVHINARMISGGFDHIHQTVTAFLGHVKISCLI